MEWNYGAPPVEGIPFWVEGNTMHGGQTYIGWAFCRFGSWYAPGVQDGNSLLLVVTRWLAVPSLVSR